MPRADTLSIPRMGVFAASAANATREADIDLYVSTDPSLTNLNPVAISNCVDGTQVGAPAGANFDGASLGRGGTEFVVDTNSQSRTPKVYYIGVKSEDQMAAEYGFMSIFSATPFSQMQERQPDGQRRAGAGEHSRRQPGRIRAKATSSAWRSIRCTVGTVTVTNQIAHQNFGDLIGTLTLNGASSDVLNNHDSFGNPPGPYSTAL